MPRENKSTSKPRLESSDGARLSAKEAKSDESDVPALTTTRKGERRPSRGFGEAKTFPAKQECPKSSKADDDTRNSVESYK